MTGKQFKYDIAFSFLEQDKNLAKILNDELNNKFETFIYLDRQNKIAGANWKETFDKVFSEEAKFVVVLYRKGWGETTLTKIEESAIEKRASGEGYDFTLFITMDEPPVVPKFVPGQNIWFGIHKFGHEMAQCIIGSKLLRKDERIVKETTDILARRIKEGEEFYYKRRVFLNSVEGVDRAENELGKLFNLLKGKTENFGKGQNQLAIVFYQEKDLCKISYYHYYILFKWALTYGNALSGSELILSLEYPKYRNEKPIILEEFIFNFDLLTGNQLVWTLKSDQSTYYTSEKLAGFSLELLLDRVEEERKNNIWIHAS